MCLICASFCQLPGSVSVFVVVERDPENFQVFEIAVAAVQIPEDFLIVPALTRQDLQSHDYVERLLAA